MLTAISGPFMATGRISKRAVDALRCPAIKDRTFLWDNSLAGFGVTAFPSGTKVYVAQFRKDGRSRRIAIGEHGRLTPGEARSEAKKLLGAVETGKDPIELRRAARGIRTFREVASDFMRLHVAAKRKGRTHEEYDRLLRVHLLPKLGARRIVDIKRVDIARLHSALSDRPFAANRTLALISSIWNWAARRDEVAFTNNPAKGIERNPEHGRERFLKAKELLRLGDVLRTAETKGIPWSIDRTKPTAKHVAKSGPHHTIIDPFAVAAIRLLILTGARLREILHAQWEHVDFERGILFLQDSKTGKKPVYLSAAAMSVLANLPRLEGNPHIIPGEKEGAPRADLKRPWAAIRKAAEFDRFRIHDLRHSFASLGAGASLGLPVIGKLLGHAHAVTTQRYAHLDADPMHRAVNTIGAVISAAMDGGSGKTISLKRRK
jgi:integrase